MSNRKSESPLLHYDDTSHSITSLHTCIGLCFEPSLNKDYTEIPMNNQSKRFYSPMVYKLISLRKSSSDCLIAGAERPNAGAIVNCPAGNVDMTTTYAWLCNWCVQDNITSVELSNPSFWHRMTSFYGGGV